MEEPAVASDGCDFCGRLTDAEAERRVAGYRHAIDIEVLRARSNLYADWLAAADGVPNVEDVTIAGVEKRRGVSADPLNRRRFIELHADKFDTVGVNMIALPLRLKRKLCIEWNHLYRDWLAACPEAHYDAGKREFYHEVADSEPDVQVSAWWGAAHPLTGVVR